VENGPGRKIRGEKRTRGRKDESPSRTILSPTAKREKRKRNKTQVEEDHGTYLGPVRRPGPERERNAKED